MRTRTARACAVVAVALLAAALAGGFGGASDFGVLREATELSLWDADDEASRFDAFVDAPACVPDAPPSFEEELFALEGRVDVRADARAGIVGFAVEEPVDRAFALLSSELKAKGWTCVQSGAAACGTFVKREGAHRWAFASCVRSGAATCVVVQVVPTEEGGA